MSTAFDLKSPSGTTPADRSTVLIVDNGNIDAEHLSHLLKRHNYEVLLTQGCSDAVMIYQTHSINAMFIAAEFINDQSCDAIAEIKALSSERYVPVMAIVAQTDDQNLRCCVDDGVDDYLECPYAESSVQLRLQLMESMRELKHAYKASIDEQVIGKKILCNALASRNMTIEHIDSLSRAAAVFSGDLTLMARQPDGKLHILLADFTGHGLSAAIGVLPVADAFSVMTEKGFEPDVIIQQINNKLYTLLPTGMFMAISVLQLDCDLQYANVWNAGMPDVYLIDYRSGHIRERIGSQGLPLGICEHIDDIPSDHLKVSPGDLFILHTDGLTDSIGTDGELFGVERFEMLLNRTAEVESVFDLVVRELDEFCGERPLADDISLVCVPCIHEVVQAPVDSDLLSQHVTHDYNGSWRWMMELSGASLHDVDPVPVVIHEYNKLTVQPVSMMALHNVLTELYRNALEYGVFRTVRKQMERTYRCNRDDITNANLLDGSYIRIELQQVRYKNHPAMLIRMEDSGRGFDHHSVMQNIENKCNDVSVGYGLKLVSETCESLVFNSAGNTVEAIISAQSQAEIIQ